MRRTQINFLEWEKTRRTLLVTVVVLAMLGSMFIPAGVDIAYAADPQVGDWIEFAVDYSSSSGTWTLTETGTEDDVSTSYLSNVDCFYTEATFNGGIDRSVTYPLNSAITMISMKEWRSVEDLRVVKVFAVTDTIIGLAESWRYYRYLSGDAGWPYEVGDTWTYREYTVSAFNWNDTWTVNVTGTENIDVNGTQIPCYVVKHTWSGTNRLFKSPSNTVKLTEWWPISGKTIKPLKRVDSISYKYTETWTASNADPMPPAGTAPTVATNAASSVGGTSATLNGNLSDLGTAGSVDVSFEWGTDTNYGSETTPESVSATGAFTADLSSLSPCTEYHFRAKAEGDLNPVYGDDQTFTTDCLPTLSFDSATYTPGEGDGTVNLSEVVGSDVTVNYATSDGTAAAGSDYTVASGTLTFASGETSKIFDITITDDSVVEAGETVTITLSNPSANAALGSPSSATLTITDNDVPNVTFSTATPSAGEADGTATITVELSETGASTITVDYATSDGTAAAGSDYTAASDTLNLYCRCYFPDL